MKITKVPNTIKNPIRYPCLMECEEGCVYLISNNPHSDQKRATLVFRPNSSSNTNEVGATYSSITTTHLSLLETNLLMENT